LKRKFLNFKIIIKFVIYYFINLFIFSSKDIKDKTILLVRLDVIGDYVLFRNFLEVIKNNEKYKGYELTLLGNIAWKDLAIKLDSQWVDNFIWLDVKKLNKNFLYRYKKLKEISSTGYELVINPSYSRDYFPFFYLMIALITAKEKIGSVGDNSHPLDKKMGAQYYTQLIPVKDRVIFEFNRNIDFFEELLNKKLPIIRTEIVLPYERHNFQLPKPYAIIFIGASKSFRKWHIKKYAEVAQYLNNVYEYGIVLCGGLNDKKEAESFANYFNDDYIDLVGKTSLLELSYLIKDSKILISNETVAPHIAVALNVKNIFVLSNGNHLGRFSPYPKNITKNYHAIYHPNLSNNVEEHASLSNQFKYRSSLNINEISSEKVINKIKMNL